VDELNNKKRDDINHFETEVLLEKYKPDILLR